MNEISCNFMSALLLNADPDTIRDLMSLFYFARITRQDVLPPLSRGGQTIRARERKEEKGKCV